MRIGWPTAGGAWGRLEVRLWGAALLTAVTILLLAFVLPAHMEHDRAEQVAVVVSLRADQRQDQYDARKGLTTRMNAADPRAHLAEVATRNEILLRVLDTWTRNGRQGTGLRLVQQAQSACLVAVVEYNAVAARFSEVLSADLPDQIDMADVSMNCAAGEFSAGSSLL